MRFFVYGTLMDADIRADLLGGEAARLTIRPAILRHYGRRRAYGGCVPVVVPRAGGRVPGLLLEGMSYQAALWAAHFEGPGYLPLRVETVDMAGWCHGAWCFLPTILSPASRHPWSLRIWQQRHKAMTRRLVAQWRRPMQRGYPLSLDVPWWTRRRLAEMAALDETGPSCFSGPSDVPRMAAGQIAPRLIPKP